MLSDIGVGIVNSLFAAITIIVLSVFMLNSARGWLDAIADRYPPDRARWLKQLYDRIGATVGNYVAGALLQATIAGVLAWIMLSILGVPYALPLSVVVFLLDLVPLVGATLGAIIVGVVTLFSDFPVDTDHLGDLLRDLPAGREHGHPAADPGARGRGAPARRARLGAVREHAVRRARRAAGDPRGGRDPDHDPRVQHLQEHPGGGPAPAGRAGA